MAVNKEKITNATSNGNTFLSGKTGEDGASSSEMVSNTANTEATNPDTTAYANGFGGTSDNDQAANEQTVYDYLRSAAAKELVDSNIQLANARQNSQKALATQLAASGMGGSGYGTTMGVGLQNAYMAGLANNQSNYADTVNDIAQQEATANAESTSNYVTAVEEAIGNATTDEELADALALGNIQYDSSTGTFSGEGWDNLTSEQQRFIQYYYGTASKNIGNTNASNSLANVVSSMSNVSNEGKYLQTFASNYQNEGTVIKLTNSKGDKHEYLKYENGKWVKITGDEYENSKGNMYEIMGASDDGSTATVYDWTKKSE